uniref:Uncharacterized protein n=1 Tax=Ananas comosus var. bracteatus TaxID=296719 RepID=A0A6V7PBH6_ANACO|nr:unnamed protein product [Ananas comosus var. bracteatus]
MVGEVRTCKHVSPPSGYRKPKKARSTHRIRKNYTTTRVSGNKQGLDVPEAVLMVWSATGHCGKRGSNPKVLRTARSCLSILGGGKAQEVKRVKCARTGVVLGWVTPWEVGTLHLVLEPVHQLDMCGESRLSQGLDDGLARRVSHRLVILGCVCDWTDEDVRALTGGVCDTLIIPHRMGMGLSLDL